MNRRSTRIGLAAALCASGALWVRRRLFGRGGDAAAKAAVVTMGGSLASAGPDELSLLSWNILADVMHQGGDWQERWAQVTATLAAAGADIVCLQECDTDRLDQILGTPALAGRYEGVPQDTKGRAGDCVCVTFAARGRLRLWWQHSRSRVLVTAYLLEDSGGATQALYVVNAHLSGHPRKPQERVAQLKNALGAMAAHQREQGLPPEACNVVVAGDLNSLPGEAPCRLLLEGCLEAGARERGVEVTGEQLEHPYLLRDAYAAAGLALPFTRKVAAGASTLDYVCASSHLGVSAALASATRRDAAALGGYPDSAHPSDHVPLGVKLRLLPAAL